VALGNSPGANPAEETFSYDPLYRLTSVMDGASTIQAFTYNATGDRLSKASTGLSTGSYSYAIGTHHLNTIGNGARAFDANGNTTASVTASQTFGFGYNGRNRMTVVQENSQTIGTYAYNDVGERVGKTATTPVATTERFFYDLSGHLIGEYGTTNVDYAWIDDLPIAVSSNPSSVSYVHSDGMNTPRAVTNSSGVSVWQWSYAGNAFGELTPTGTATFNLRLPGQYFDLESGLAYNVNRDYEASSGRYLQSDPIGLFGGSTTYGYSDGNPLLRSDKLGLQTTAQQCWEQPEAAEVCIQEGFLPRRVPKPLPVAPPISVPTTAPNHGDKDNCPDCGPDTRFEAEVKAMAWAGMTFGDNCEEIPWSDYSGRGGPNYSYVRGHGGNMGGCRNGRSEIKNHPDGHPGQTGPEFPDHHSCPHFHARNEAGVEMIFPYRRET